MLGSYTRAFTVTVTKDQVRILVKSHNERPCNLYEQFLAYVLEYFILKFFSFRSLKVPALLDASMLMSKV